MKSFEPTEAQQAALPLGQQVVREQMGWRGQQRGPWTPDEAPEQEQQDVDGPKQGEGHLQAWQLPPLWARWVESLASTLRLQS